MAKGAVLKRIKITKTGKIMHRKSGQNHFNAKESRRVQLRQKRLVIFPKTVEKKIKRYL